MEMLEGESLKEGEGGVRVGSEATYKERQAVLELRVRCQLNLAQCHIRTHAFDAAIRAADAVLAHQPDNLKALFRYTPPTA